MAAHVDHLARSRIAALVARRSDGLVDRADAAEPNQDQAAAHKDAPCPETKTMCAPYWCSSCFSPFQSRAPPILGLISRQEASEARACD